MANENANQDIEFDDFDLECEQISNQLEEQLKEHVEGLEFLKEEIEQIGNPDYPEMLFKRLYGSNL